MILKHQGVFLILNIVCIEMIKSRIFVQIIKKKIKKTLDGVMIQNLSIITSLLIFHLKMSAEKLYLKENIYDIILVINYNLNPVKKNKGSAIFLHVAKKNFGPTKGCLAIKKRFFKNFTLNK